ncbi:MAG: hypothetical protein R2860_16925 [Desulfobacterales bacterium]
MEEGLDILLVADGNNFFVKELTEKGAASYKGSRMVGDADADAASKIDELKKTAEATITAAVETDKLREKPYWNSMTHPSGKKKPSPALTATVPMLPHLLVL